MNHLILTRDALNVGEISQTVSAESCGAISLFVGTTRDCFDGKRVGKRFVIFNDLTFLLNTCTAYRCYL